MTEKTLGNSDISGTKKNVPDVVVFGDGDAWQLLCKASSEEEGWMKSTKAMEMPGGVLIQVTTQQRNAYGSYAVAEALAFVPDVGDGIYISSKHVDDDPHKPVISRGIMGY